MKTNTMFYVDRTLNKLLDLAISFGPRLILALLFLFIGLKVIKILSRLIEEALKRSHMEQTVRLFLSRLIFWSLKVLLFVSVASMVGIETTSFVAMIGAAGLAIGLAFQGTLSNFAGGVLILTLKPFKVGDNINAQGYAGSVEEISIFNTKIITGDNRVALIPNGVLANSSLMNMTAKDIVRIEMKFYIPTNGDIMLSKKIISDSLSTDERIHLDPAPVIAVLELTETSIVIVARVWAIHQNYWPIYFDHIEKIKTGLNEKGLFYLKT